MPAWLPLLVLLGRPMAVDPSLYKMEVRIAGPLAMVDVWRTVEASTRTTGDRQTSAWLDLDLPDGAALLDWEILEGRVPTRLARKSEVEANAALTAGQKLRRLSPPTPAEEGTDLRVHLTPIADGERAVLHFRYSAPAGCQDGHLVLRIPESLEPAPVPAEVAVTIEALSDGTPLAAASLAGRPATLRAGARKAVLRGTVPARPAWEIAWRYSRISGTLPGIAVAAAARVPGVSNQNGRARAVPRYELTGLFCRSDAAADLSPPAQVLLLVDRSRSVGQGGLSAQRLLARALVEALPPSVSFNAILFGATAAPLFRVSRMPTREALDGFTNAADPNRLENGTDVVGALGRARGLLELDGGSDRAWVVLVTDGSLPAHQTSEKMQAALFPSGGRAPKVLVLLVRQHGDEKVPSSAIAEYARFARRFGGIVRVVAPASPAEVARSVVAAMAKGGDLLDLRIEGGLVADAVPPGQGASLTVNAGPHLPAHPRVRLRARGLDGDVRADITPVPVKREWMDPLLEGAGQRRAWSGASSGMAVVVLPPAAAPQTPDAVVRGRMDPAVLKNALALAFTPRARACYVSRRVVKAQDAYLRGRLKLELDIERGELLNATIRHSTLDHPAIEDCVRKAAWAVEYPRPEHRDAPIIANVNLVFAPRTPRESPPDASATDREIEIIVGPLTFPEDYRDLLGPPDGGR